jgi:hypothetical protein
MLELKHSKLQAQSDVSGSTLLSRGRYMFQVEQIWNREFHFISYGEPHPTLDQAIEAAESIENSGDGGRVKKTRVLNEQGDVVWAYGKRV